MESNDLKPRTTAKDFFLYGGVMILLYGSVAALINLIFAYVNYSFPDQLSYDYDPFSGVIKWAMAFLIILFPVFLVGTWFINKDLRLHPEKDTIGIRKWLTFLALFIAGGGILIDLSVLVYKLLDGELTMRFGLKVLAVLIIAGYTLSYYLFDLKGLIREKREIGRIFGGVAAFLVLTSIVSGFFIIGLPGTQRDLRFDQQRIIHLQEIQSQVVNYWQRTETFPKAISDLNDKISNYTVPVDPETAVPYELILGEGYAFKLCATFNHESFNGKSRTPVAKPIGMSLDENWQHGIGRVCFERVIDPRLYPPFRTAPVKI